MEETKVKQLHTNVNGMDKQKSGKEELVKREKIKNSPFEIITQQGKSFGIMGDYRVTEQYEKKAEVKKELKEITWNRIVQVIMILDEVKGKLKNKIK